MEESNNLIKQGIDYAAPMGLYTAAMSLSWIYADVVPFLSYLLIILLLGGPVLLYKMQRRYHLACDSQCRMWDLWLLGVITIFFGAVFTLMVTYGVLEFARPSFMYEQTQRALEIYRQSPELKDTEVVQTLEMMMDRDLMPKPWDTSLTMFFLTNVSGMVMGTFTAMLAERK